MNKSDSDVYSILKKVADPDGGISRLSYFIEVEFSHNNLLFETTLKIDTGSPYTIIGADSVEFEFLKFDHDFETSVVTGQPIDLKDVIVDNFKLSDEIVFDKIKILFSKALGKHSLLGMDILTLFNWSYRKEVRSNDGYLSLHNYINVMNDARQKMLKYKLDYFSPTHIAAINEIQTVQNQRNIKITREVAEAAYINKLINK